MDNSKPNHPENFQLLWIQLLNFARWKGIPYNDALDLVQNTFLAALSKFEEHKGGMGALCRTALKNLIINYWRDKKHPEMIDEELLRGDDPMPDEIMIIAEREKRMKDQLERIRKELTVEELAFMEAYGKALEDLEDRAVSEAARMLGLTPLQGHDILRRIRRKVRNIEEWHTIQLAHPAAAPPPPGKPVAELNSSLMLDRSISPVKLKVTRTPEMGKPERRIPPRFDIARAYAHEVSFDRFWAALGPHQREILMKM